MRHGINDKQRRKACPMNCPNWKENGYGLNLDVLKPRTYGMCRVSFHVGHTPIHILVKIRRSYPSKCRWKVGSISSHTLEHTLNLAKSKSYRGLKLVMSDTKFMTTVNSMVNYQRFQEK
jgi:hypothetical protein